MFRDLQTTITAVEAGFGAPRILVIGDLMLDRHWFGAVERISPEAPVPVVRIRHQSCAPGGAGNVARNLASLGCVVNLAGVLGDDAAGKDFLQCMQTDGVNTAAVLIDPARATTEKTRIIGGHQQILRLDTEEREALEAPLRERLCKSLAPQIHRCSVIVLSDYAKGVLGEEVCQFVIRAARQHSIPVLVDPKGDDYTRYKGATMLSPNRAEIAIATHSPSGDLGRVFENAEILRERLGVEFFAITLGDLGTAVLERGSIYRCPAKVREVFDVSGAGDTVMAVWAAGMAMGLDRHDCANLANLAAGIVIGKLGTTAVSKHELLGALSRQKRSASAAKICTLEQLQRQTASWRARGERIVFTNGCFDLVHVGHITLLERAKQEGNRLIVALNSDASVRSLKGPARPIVGQYERAQVLASLTAVDAVVLFDEDTPLKLIRCLYPDVLVKGGDYKEHEVVGADEISGWGGKVVLVPLVEGQSTTRLLSKARLNSLPLLS